MAPFPLERPVSFLPLDVPALRLPGDRGRRTFHKDFTRLPLGLQEGSEGFSEYTGARTSTTDYETELTEEIGNRKPVHVCRFSVCVLCMYVYICSVENSLVFNHIKLHIYF